jgi:phage FluMu protein gp41
MKSQSLKPDDSIFEGPESALERMLIADYLKGKGIASIKELSKLSKENTKRLMQEACRYASLKLAEVESLDRFQRKLQTGG